MALTYVLPIRWTSDEGLPELTRYLRWLSSRVELVIVDGSPLERYTAHAREWADLGVHIPPDDDLRFLNGKVNGVHTGLRRATHDAVIVADDDVRYDDAGLTQMEDLLGEFDLVRPQNYFDPTPWHALWDTGRTLINRALGGDWPGTMGVRRRTFVRVGGYDGDVLFENLELVRTVRAAGGRTRTALDVLVRRRPPSARTFWSQRVRQAYDEFARPSVLVLWLCVVPIVIACAIARRWFVLAMLAFSAAVLAEAGRRRAGGCRVYPARATLFAPVWVFERGICAWAAVYSRLVHGGVRYRGVVVRAAATPRRALRTH